MPHGVHGAVPEHTPGEVLHHLPAALQGHPLCQWQSINQQTIINQNPYVFLFSMEAIETMP